MNKKSTNAKIEVQDATITVIHRENDNLIAPTDIETSSSRK